MYKGYIEAVFSKDSSSFSVLCLDYYKPPHLILMHGISGAGKSTVTNYIKEQIEGKFYTDEQCVICSTDDYHYIDGQYVFQPDKLSYFHKLNQEAATQHLKDGHIVIVDNTNLTIHECLPYLKPVLELGLDYCIIEPTGPNARNAEVLAQRNKHSVPLEAIKRMISRMESREKIEYGLSIINKCYDLFSNTSKSTNL